MEEIAGARNFAAAQTVVQIYGTCEECRTGRKTPPIDGATTELVFARDALRMAIATERSGLEFYTRAASLTKDARGRTVFQKLAAEEREHLGTLEKRYRELLAEDPQLESRPTFLFFKGAASGLFAEGAEQLREGVDDQQALLIGIKCERGSHKFFKRYGERFEDSEGKQIFLEFADEERAHLDLLIREYRALRASRREPRAVPRPLPGRAPSPRRRDRSSHPHDRVRRPLHAGGARRARGGGRRHRAERHRPRHRRRCDAAAAACAAGIEFVPGIEITRSATRPTCTCSAISSIASPRCARFSRSSAAADRPRPPIIRLAGYGSPRRRRDPAAGDRRSEPSVGRPWIARALAARRTCKRRTRRSIDWLARGRPAFVAAARRVARGSHRHASTTPAASRRSRIPGSSDTTSGLRRLPTPGLDALEAYHTDHDAGRRRARYRRDWRQRLGLAVSGGSDFHADESHGAAHPGSVSLPRDAYEQLARLKRRSPQYECRCSRMRRSLLHGSRRSALRGGLYLVATIRATASGAVTSS